MDDQTEAASSSRRWSRETRLHEQGQEILRDARALTAAAAEAAEEVGRLLGVQMARRPYTTLATAAGVGYVVGGGLASQLTRIVLGMGSRFAMAFAARELSNLLESTVRSQEVTS